ncbi:hypothetical protein FRC01_006115 [Tulasnella sp. 417]|nr:hypothetical protein FRC01_006115 [Tulasnella sp. 417]
MTSCVNPQQAETIATVNNGGNPVVPHGAVANLRKPTAYQLPTEILTYIIHWALPSVKITPAHAVTTSDAYMRLLYALRQVSKRWQDLVDGTPSFWTVILSTLPFHANNATIFRSASGPLTIVFEDSEEPNTSDRGSAFLGMIAHTRSRWSTIYLNGCSENCLAGFLATPAPLLRTVAVFDSWREGEEPLELLGGQTANLRHVELSEVPLQWRTGLFMELKSLSMTAVTSDLTTNHIIDFLEASPGLEELCIEGDFELSPNQASFPLITLSRLRTIRLAGDRGKAVDCILRHVRVPSWLTFYVNLGAQWGYDFDYQLFMNETMEPFQETFREIHIKNGASGMWFNSHAFRWQSFTPGHAGGKRVFSIFMEGFHPMGVRWVERILRGETGLQVEFGYIPVLGSVLRGLAHLRCLTRVSITVNDVQDVHAILRFLYQPLGPSPSTPSLPCLRELSLQSWGWNAQDILDMVQRRWTAFSEPNLDPPPLTINIWRGPFGWNDDRRPILDLATLDKIRGAKGVECVRVVEKHDVDGMLAIIWNEETSKPTRGEDWQGSLAISSVALASSASSAG